MGAREKSLKKQLHESIESIEDEEVLYTVKNIVEHISSKTKIQLTEEQIQRIENANKSIDDGDYLTNEQADELISKWLKE